MVPPQEPAETSRNAASLDADAKTVRFTDDRAQRGFTQIPNELLFDTDLSAGALRLWCVLASFAWRDEKAWCGQERLADVLGVTDRSVRTYRQELEERKLLETRRRGLGKTNLYLLSLPVGAEADFRSYDRKQASDKEYEGKKTKTSSRQSPRERKPDPVWDALVAVCGAPATRSETSDFAKTVSEIRKVLESHILEQPYDALLSGMRAAIEGRRREFLRRYPDATFSHRVLRNRWNELRPSRGSGAAGSPWRELADGEA